MDEYIKQLKDYKKTNGEPLSSQSIDNYTRTIKLIVDNIGWKWNLEILNKYFDDKNLELTSRKGYINAIINYLTLIKDDENLAIFKQERHRMFDELKNLPNINPKKKDKVVDWTEIEKWLKTVNDENNIKRLSHGSVPISDLMVEVILNIQILFQRRNEVADLKYYTNPNDINDKENFLYHQTTEDRYYLIFNDYKSSGAYHKQIFELKDTNLKTLLKEHLAENQYRPYMFYLPSKKDTPMSRTNFGKLLNRSSTRILNKTLGSNYIRISYNTTKYKEIKKELFKDCINNAHSVSTKLNVYVKD